MEVHVRRVTVAPAANAYPAQVSHLLELFYSAHCVGCPEARAIVRELAARRSDLIIVEHDIDNADALDLAKGYCLIATPALVIDREIVMYGVPKLEKLAQRIEASAPAIS